MKLKLPLLVLLATFGVASADAAEKHKAKLLGYTEVPSISTTGNGELLLEISPAEDAIEFTLTYADIEGGVPSAAHIHLGQADVNGGVSVFFCGGPRPPCPPSPVTSAAPVTGTIVAADITGPTGQGITAGQMAELIKAIRAGVTYANLHNATYPGGEIRGQIK